MKRPVRHVPVKVIDDPELLELFADEPELLAITDALQATQGKRHNVARRRYLFLAAALVAVTAIAGGAVALFGDGGQSLVEQAAAAIPQGRMIEATLETPAPSTVVDLSSGVRRSVTVEIQSWLDSSTGRIRVLTRRGDVVVSDVAGSGDEIAPAASGLDPSSLTFARDYKQAVTSGHAVALPNGELEIGADGNSVRVRLSANALPTAIAVNRARNWRVTHFAAVPFDAEALVPLRTGRTANAGSVAASTMLPLDSAGKTVKQITGTSLPATIAQNRVSHASLQQLTRVSGKQTSRDSGVELAYGAGAEKVQVRLARRPEPAYGFVEGRLAFDFNPIPPVGQANVAAIGTGSSTVWIVQLRIGHGFAAIRARTRALALGAARQIAEG
jgi:hypothetical protein